MWIFCLSGTCLRKFFTCLSNSMEHNGIVLLYRFFPKLQHPPHFHFCPVSIRLSSGPLLLFFLGFRRPLLCAYLFNLVSISPRFLPTRFASFPPHHNAFLVRSFASRNLQIQMSVPMNNVMRLTCKIREAEETVCKTTRRSIASSLSSRFFASFLLISASS